MIFPRAADALRLPFRLLNLTIVPPMRAILSESPQFGKLLPLCGYLSH
jgi:hypothetical protein